MNIDARYRNFSTVSDRLIDNLGPGEQLSVQYEGEVSQFIRINDGQIRQCGCVNDASVTLNLFIADRNATMTMPLSGEDNSDFSRARESLDLLRKVVPQTLEDPNQQLPFNYGETNEVTNAALLNPDQAAGAIATEIQGKQFSGFYAAGPVMRGNRNSAGQKHWFCTETYSLDYTMLAPMEKSVKRTFAGRDWNETQFRNEIESAQRQTGALRKKLVNVAAGHHRCYLAPAAVAELVSMLSWQGLSEASMQQGTSALLGLRNGKSFSPLFNLRENYSQALVPRFNDDGELAESEITLIEKGALRQTLINARTASEYSLTSNAANSSESLRATDVAPGGLTSDEINPGIGTGIYIGNLHYLNWSDPVNARITGMTRNACFWIENGEVVGPINDLRFDDSLYNMLGESLIAVGDQQELIANIGTYERRSLGGANVPGLLVDNVAFTL